MSLRGLEIMGETRISSSSVRPGLTPALELQVVVWHVDGEVVLLHHQVPPLGRGAQHHNILSLP